MDIGRDDSHDQPSDNPEFTSAMGIASLALTRQVVITVVLNHHALLLVDEIAAGDESTRIIEDVHLRHRPRESCFDDESTGDRLTWGLRSRIKEGCCSPRRQHPALSR